MESSKTSFLQYFLYILVVILFLLLCRELFTKEVFSIESREKNISEQDFTEKDNDFETIGWVRVQGTELDLPIVNSKLMNYDYPVEKKGYTWSNLTDGKFHNNIVVKGHNVYNLSSTPKLSSDRFYRFEELMSFIYYDFAKDNEYFQITIGKDNYVYKIFAVTFVSREDYQLFPEGNDYSKDEMKSFISFLKKHSFYNYKVSVNENDSVASLVTCTRFYGVMDPVEIYVTGRLLYRGEKMYHYKVNKNKNYNDIEDKLRGDLDEEENV